MADEPRPVPPPSERPPGGAGDEPEWVCAYCGSTRLVWRKCKLVCEQCRNVNMSCEDL